MEFIFNMEGGFSSDILHRSKADYPVPEKMVTISVDGSVLDWIAKIMSYFRLWSSGKVLKKKKNERDVKGNISIVGNEFDEEKKPSKLDGGMSKNQTERESLSPPLSSRKNYVDSREKHGPSVAKSEWYGIFVGDDVEYDIPSKDMSQSPIPEDMEESPPNKERISYLGEPTYGPIPPFEPQEWQ